MAIQFLIFSAISLSCITPEARPGGITNLVPEARLRERLFIKRFPGTRLIEIGFPGIMSLKFGVDRKKCLVIGGSAGLVSGQVNIGCDQNMKIHSPMVVETTPDGAPDIIEIY
ncbi:hypothetical protein L9F63_016700 [Diploptera punctata]|uniref:Uncharacterized protein n=1 Tax=Diploptera punctata TaxID=6984 RepID=A0AAD8A2E0_DIPPU|nr:hypothetical protein L9F63_016700 [Diploptera punctata]